VLPQNNYLNI